MGAQIGGTESDVILVIMNRTGVEHLLANQVKLGAEISAAAGPVGAGDEKSTDWQIDAQILSYTRSRGLFAGVTVNGSVIKEDAAANSRPSQQPITPRAAAPLVGAAAASATRSPETVGPDG